MTTATRISPGTHKTTATRRKTSATPIKSPASKKPVAIRALMSNPITQDKWVCEDLTNITVIDRVEFINVHKEGETRNFLVRKEALTKIKTLK